MSAELERYKEKENNPPPFPVEEVIVAGAGGKYIKKYKFKSAILNCFYSLLKHHNHNLQIFSGSN